MHRHWDEISLSHIHMGIWIRLNQRYIVYDIQQLLSSPAQIIMKRHHPYPSSLQTIWSPSRQAGKYNVAVKHYSVRCACFLISNGATFMSVRLSLWIHWAVGPYFFIVCIKCLSLHFSLRFFSLVWSCLSVQIILDSKDSGLSCLSAACQF